MNFKQWMVLLIGALSLCMACQPDNRIQTFTAEAAVGPQGSLVVTGTCDAPDGALVLVRASGAVEQGAQIEQAALAEVRDGAFAADLGLHETLNYQIAVLLSPRWNAAGLLPEQPPAVSDPNLRVTEYDDAWELRREIFFRLGTPSQERALLRKHLTALEEALRALQLSEKNLRELEQARDRAGLARWLRLHLERKRTTPLDAPGVDPLFPTSHEQLRKLDRLLVRRFHAVLADLTGVGDEAGKLSRDWTMVERHNARAAEMLSALQEKINKTK